MSVAEKALWMIETRAGAPASLEEIAGRCGVSRYHLTRAFALAFGRSLIAYRNARRLSGAARKLAFSDQSVTEIAFDAGYKAPEAFARAFRAAFGATPSEVRARGAVSHLPLTEPPRLERQMTETLPAPRIEEMTALRAAGLAREVTMDE
ncbi:MAG: AraC family transcriptional regulator, partial [Pseudomonadota bacterium]